MQNTPALFPAVQSQKLQERESTSRIDSVGPLELVRHFCGWMQPDPTALLRAFQAPPAPPPFPTLRDAVQRPPGHIATFNRALDAGLGGGVPVGCVTQVAGLPNAGRSLLWSVRRA